MVNLIRTGQLLALSEPRMRCVRTLQEDMKDSKKFANPSKDVSSPLGTWLPDVSEARRWENSHWQHAALHGRIQNDRRVKEAPSSSPAHP